jgi:nucleotide-binding universal stress UspA family protein
MLDRGPILVPLDGSELAEKALPYAKAVADALRTHLVLITVWEGTESSLGETFPSIALDISKSAQEHFTRYLDEVRGRASLGSETRTIVRPGDAAEEILKAITEVDARAVAIATHGRSGITRWIYGSTAGHLLRNANVPVLAAGPNALERSDHPSLKHIMTPLDGAEMSEQALPVTAKLARALGAKVSLVRSVNWAVQSYPYSLPDAYVPQLDTELEEGAKAYLRKQEERIRADVPDIAAYAVRGAVADGLIEFEEQKDVDLVVMTTNARTGIARAALGSTADRLLQGRAPVLLIRPEGLA